MTSESAPADPADPSWAGGVDLGVSAWVGSRRAEPRSARGASRPAEPDADPEPDPESVARTILLDQLTGRARSRRELADKLASRNVPHEVAEPLLTRFEEVGLIDDAAFARDWVAGRQSAKGLARRALAHELRRKGVTDDVAREALDELEPGSEEAAARELVRRRLRGSGLSRVDDVAATRRLVGMLARKGYPPGLAHTVVRDELAAAGRDAPEADGDL